jgi:hypothetical protein
LDGTSDDAGDDSPLPPPQPLTKRKSINATEMTRFNSDTPAEDF